MAGQYDVLAMGRSSIDLYSNEVGAPFVEIKSFATHVGGCPTNISVGTRRLGLRSALLTAVGVDVVGDFILHFLEQEGVETAFIPPIDTPGFPVEVANILGAGDAFASGFLFGHIRGWDWYRAARLGNACGAIVVTRHGCANFMPTYDEVMAFVDQHGGL